MKKRMMGLLAMVLCLMISCMPVAMADFWVNPEADGPVPECGWLIEGGTILETYVSGGADAFLYYGTATDPEQKTVVVPHGTQTTVDSGMWYVRESGHYHMNLESMGNLVMSYPYEENENLSVFIFDRPFPTYSEDGELEDVMAAFNNWVEENTPGAALKAYDADLYERVFEGVWYPYDLSRQTQFYLPGANGEVLAVLHWSHYGYLEELEFDDTNKGLLVKGIQECSPFAIVYKPAPEPTATPKPVTPAVPQTGDSTPLALLGILACVSFAGIVLLVIRRKKAA